MPIEHYTYTINDTQHVIDAIDVADVVVRPDRTRQEFKEKPLEDLASSIYSIGLLNAIVLEDFTCFLATGERRLRACKMLAEAGLPIRHRGFELPVGKLPFIYHFAETDLERLQAEVDENIMREDLTWQERAIAEARLHELRTLQHGEYKRGVAGVSDTVPGWTIADTAAEIRGQADGPKPTGQHITDVSDSIDLAQFMDDPLVANAKSKREAVKIMRDIQRAQDREKRAAALILDELPHQLHHCSYVDAPIEPESVDVFVIDPPYGRDMNKHKFGTNHEYDDTSKWWDEHITSGLFASTVTRFAKPNSHAYIFCDFLRFDELFVQFEVAGWTCLRRPIIWDKGTIGTYGNHEYEPRHVYDCILHARRGDRPFIVMDRDVIDDVQYVPDRLPHPAGKPPDLYANLLRRSVNPGDTVADLMCGCGPIFPAAQAAKCIAHGVEVNPKYNTMARITLGELLK